MFSNNRIRQAKLIIFNDKNGLQYRNLKFMVILDVDLSIDEKLNLSMKPWFRNISTGLIDISKNKIRIAGCFWNYKQMTINSIYNQISQGNWSYSFKGVSKLLNCTNIIKKEYYLRAEILTVLWIYTKVKTNSSYFSDDCKFFEHLDFLTSVDKNNSKL